MHALVLIMGRGHNDYVARDTPDLKQYHLVFVVYRYLCFQFQNEKKLAEFERRQKTTPPDADVKPDNWDVPLATVEMTLSKYP